MAKYDVTYACGHTETVELFGKTSERERKIEWMEGNCLCPSCYKEKQQKEAEAFDLPELTGTPKQVAWAEKIREELTAVVEENMGQEWFGLNALDLETSAATIIGYHTDYKGRFDDLLEALAKRAKEL